MREELIDDLADAILDGAPIDWAAAESSADAEERTLFDSLKVLAALADVHRFPPHVPTIRTLSDDEDALGSTPTPPIQPHDEVVGSFRLIELLGRGGMGEVYLAERADGRFDQQVAVKLVKRGMDSREILRRFGRERRILARLQHPGIARLLDAGEARDGRPYFVMERVEGERITEYCRSRGLSLEARLELVASCCDAVDSAHRSLVVHRDLKPSNLMVTRDGQVKLLDFGIATLLNDEEVDSHVTAPGRRVLTPSYAAPEQILGGDVTVATDVFALGIVLYELVTGTLPFDRRSTTAHDLTARVEHETADRASSAARKTSVSGEDAATRERWARRLRGDLDTIIAKAMAREPARRYTSAAALADDLRRYLTSRPVEARPDSRSYRIRKFIVRHRVGVASAAVVATAIVVALGVSLAQTAAARREAERAAASQAFVVSLFEQIDPNRYVGSAPTVRDLLERGSERLDRELAQQPELRAEMQALLGQMFDQLSLFDRGLAHWRRAVETRLELFGADDARTAKARKGMAISYARQSRFAEADTIFRELLEQNAVMENPRELGSVLLNYGNMKRLTGDYATSQTLLERAVHVLEKAAVEDTTVPLAPALGNLGLVYWRQGQLREAAGTMERGLAIHLKNNDPRSSVVALGRKNLSHVYRDLGELDAAERYAQEALAVGEGIFPPHHPFIGTTLESLGQLAETRGELAKAREFYERSIASYAGSVRPDDPGAAHPMRFLAGLMLQDGRTAEALRLYERALELRRKAFGDTHRDVAQSFHDLARGRLAAQDLTGALEALRAGVAAFRVALPGSPELAAGLVLLGDALRRHGRPQEALAPFEEALGIWQKKPPRNPQDLTDLEAALAATRTARR